MIDLGTMRVIRKRETDGTFLLYVFHSKNDHKIKSESQPRDLNPIDNIQQIADAVQKGL